MSDTKIIYRIIKYEGTEEALAFQLDHSVQPGFKYQVNKDLTITVKDRNDDPNESTFFDDVKMAPVLGMITAEQYRGHCESAKEMGIK